MSLQITERPGRGPRLRPRRPAFSSSFFYSVWCCSTNVPLSYVAEVHGIRKVNWAELEQRLKLMVNEALAESLAAMSPSTTG